MLSMKFSLLTYWIIVWPICPVGLSLVPGTQDLWVLLLKSNTAMPGFVVLVPRKWCAMSTDFPSCWWDSIISFEHLWKHVIERTRMTTYAVSHGLTMHLPAMWKAMGGVPTCGHCLQLTARLLCLDFTAASTFSSMNLMWERTYNSYQVNMRLETGMMPSKAFLLTLSL